MNDVPVVVLFFDGEAVVAALLDQADYVRGGGLLRLRAELPYPRS
jgi:hypothetical protein